MSQDNSIDVDTDTSKADQPGRKIIKINSTPKAELAKMSPDELERMRKRNRLLTARYAPLFMKMIDDFVSKGLKPGKDFSVTCLECSIPENELQEILELTGSSRR